MAKRTTKKTVFLIVDDNDQRNELAKGLRDAGYDVHAYMTAREFLIDKQNYSGGVVVTEYRLHGIAGPELCQQLAREGADFPAVMIARRADVSTVLAGKVSDLVVIPVTIKSLQEAITRATEGDDFSAEELELAFRKVTEREREICELIVDGKASREIAAALEVSTKHVETHRVKIMDKTRADDVGHLARMWRA